MKSEAIKNNNKHLRCCDHIYVRVCMYEISFFSLLFILYSLSLSEHVRVRVFVKRVVSRLSVLLSGASSSATTSSAAASSASPARTSRVVPRGFLEREFLQLHRSRVVFRIQLWEEFSTVFHLRVVIFRLFRDVEFIHAASS